MNKHKYIDSDWRIVSQSVMTIIYTAKLIWDQI